jgi:SSS family solute:Na+ symporter
MTTTTIIFIGVGIYIAVMLGVGLYAAKKNTSATEFIVAGRRMPMFLCTATIIATWFGSGSMMGAAGAAYDDGLFGVIADPFGATLALFLIGMFFARFYRRLRLLTFMELIEQRFGKVAGSIATFAAVASNIGWVGGMLIAFGVIFETLTGTPMHVGILGGSAVVVVYTMLGGLWAVAITDFVQIVIILVGVIVLFVVVLIDVGGWSAISAQIPDDSFRMLPLENTGEQWLNYIRMWVIFGLADIGSQSLLGRAMAADSERTAQNSFYYAAAGYLTFAMIPVTLGIIASVTMPELSNAESVIPMLALEHLHPVAVAVFVGAILAAVMSTCDSALLSAASLISRNILPLVRRSPSDALSLSVVRYSIPAIAIIGVGIALTSKDIYDLIVDANIIMLTAATVPILAAVWWSKANRTGALAAMVVGFSTWLISRSVAPELPGDLIGMGVSFVTMVVVSLMTQEQDPPRPALDIDGNVVEFKNRLGTLGIRGVRQGPKHSPDL